MPEIDKTPGQLIFASLVCFFGGFLVVIMAAVLSGVFQNEDLLELAVLSWPLWFASKILVIATIVACFNKKPGYR